MRKLFYFFTLLFIATTLNAQDTTDIKPKHEYAFVYYYNGSLRIYFDNGKKVDLEKMTFKDLGIGSGYNSQTNGFDIFVKAFNYLESREYEFMATGITESPAIPYYIYRKKKQ